MRHLLFVHTAGDAGPYVRRLRQLGFRASLIKHRPTAADRGCFESVSDIDYQTDLGAALACAADLHRRDPLDGVLSFSESGVLGASFIASHLGLPGNAPAAVLRARNKFLMRTALARAGLATPQFHLVDSARQVCEILGAAGEPMVLKPISGSSSYGVVRVAPSDAAAEVEAHFDAVLSYIRDYRANNPDYPFEFWLPDALFGIAPGDVCDPAGCLLLEGFIPGRQVSVDGVVSGGAVSCFGVIEIERIKDDDYFLEYEEWMPTRLGAACEDAVQDAAAAAVRALGLSDGCFHCELKVDGDAICVLEIAARRGADNIADFLARVQGVDIYSEAARIACAEQRVHARRRARGAMKMRYFLPGCAGVLRRIDGVEAVRRDPHVSELCVDFEVGETVLTPPDGFEFLGYLSVSADDAASADRVLDELYPQVSFEIDAEVPAATHA